LIGRAFKFQVQHILEVLDKFRREGLIKTQGWEEARLTFHDPCQLVRRGGVVRQPRDLLNMVAKNFVEMSDAGMMNWCCGGGGGLSAIEEAEELRIKVFKHKKDQLDELKVETLVTACANCRNIIEEGFEAYQMTLPVVGLTEMIADHLVVDTKISANTPV